MMKTPNLDPVVSVLPAPAAPNHGSSDGTDAAPTESFGQVMARVGGERTPRSESARAGHDSTPKATGGGAPDAATERGKAGPENEAQASAAEAAANEIGGGKPTEEPGGEDEATKPATASIDALLVAVADVSRPAGADEAGSASAAAPTRGSAPAAGRGTILGRTFANASGANRATAPAATVADPTRAAGAAAPATEGAGNPVRQDATFAPAVQGAAPTGRPQPTAPADPMPPAGSGNAGTTSAVLASAAAANDQTKAGSHERGTAAPALPALPPPRAPIAEALAAVAAKPDGGEAIRSAAQEQIFERLLGGHALGAPRAEPAQHVLPFAHLPATSTIAAAETVATPVGQPGFAQDLSQRVMLLVNGQVKSAELALTPAELGPVRVSIELRGQDASISFVAAAPATRAALEEALPRLREMFTQQGLNLLDANVGAHVGQQGQRTYGRPQSAAGGDRDEPTMAPAVGATGGMTAGAGRPARLIDVIA